MKHAAAILASLALCTSRDIRAGSGIPPASAALQSGAIPLIRSDRELHLMTNGAPMRKYDISLRAASQGHRCREKDEQTLEGNYVIDWRYPNSVATLSPHISDPDANDFSRAAARNVSPSWNIIIQGLPNGRSFLEALHRPWDWTDGYIAVTNAEI